MPNLLDSLYTCKMSDPFNPNTLSAQAIQTELETAVASATGSRASKVYKKISAVLIHFDDDDIGCDAPEKELAETFRRFYHIDNIRYIQIQNQNPHLALALVFNDLDDNGYTSEGCLVILVFSGHGKIHRVFYPDSAREPIHKLKLG